MTKIVKIVISIIVLIGINCVNQQNDNNYGSINRNLLSSLTWQQCDIKSYSHCIVNRYKQTITVSNDTAYSLLQYECNSNSCDTLYRFDTTKANNSYSLISDTLIVLSYTFGPSRYLITKLTEDELVLFDLSDTYYHYPRNDRPLVTIGTGTNTGNNIIDYHE